MIKINKKLRCCNKEINLFIYDDDVKTQKYNKSILQKHFKSEHNMDILQYINNYIIPLQKCGFCENYLAQYDYEIDLTNDVINFKNIKLHKNVYKCNNKTCIKNRAILNSNSNEHIMKRLKCSLEEAQNWRLLNNHSPFYKRTDETEEEYKKRQSRSKQWFINRYGEEEGVKRWKARALKVSEANKKENMIKRFGVEKTNQICNNKKHTIENYIKRYGETNGIEKYKEHIITCTKMSAYVHNKRIDSKQAYNFFTLLKQKICEQIYNIRSEDIIFADGINSEIALVYLEQNKLRYYKLDFVIKSIKVDIEFKGSTWHAGEHNKNNFTNPYHTYDQILEHDLKREQYIKDQGYYIISVWDYQISSTHIDDTVNNIIKNIKDYINEKFK